MKEKGFPTIQKVLDCPKYFENTLELAKYNFRWVNPSTNMSEVTLSSCLHQCILCIQENGGLTCNAPFLGAKKHASISC